MVVGPLHWAAAFDDKETRLRDYACKGGEGPSARSSRLRCVEDGEVEVFRVDAASIDPILAPLALSDEQIRFLERHSVSSKWGTSKPTRRASC